MKNTQISLSEEELIHTYISLSRRGSKLISKLIEKGVYNPNKENIETQTDEETRNLIQEFHINNTVLKKLNEEITKEHK